MEGDATKPTSNAEPIRKHLCQLQSHEALLELAHSITVEEVNLVARSLLSFTSHYQNEEEALAAAAAAPQQWMDWGPTRTSAIVACIPAFTDESGHSTGRDGCSS